MINRFSVLLFLAALGTNSLFALAPSRAYKWSFHAGNLAANWSFENSLEFWSEAPLSGFTLSTRLKAQGSGAGSAKSGSFVAQVAGSNSTGAIYQAIRSDRFPILPGESYTLSFYYKTVGISGSIRPSITWSKALDGNENSISGTNLANASNWTLATLSFAAASQAQYLRIILAEFLNGGSGTIYFDDVVLEEGALSSAQVEDNRKKNIESVTFEDALGRTHQIQTKIQGSPEKVLVQGVGFDDFARPETTFLPIPVPITAPSFQTNLRDSAQNYYDVSGPFNANGYPFSRAKYSDESNGRVLESTSLDSAWQFGKGHTVKQDFYYVNDTLVPSNIESPPSNSVECKYRLDWMKSPDSSFALTWTNKLGQVVRVAQNITRNSLGANTWKWSTSRYEYYPSGQVKRMRTPIDDSAGTDALAEIFQFNGQGQAISSYSPDRKLRKFWYNRFGQIRYTQDSVQRSQNKYSYYEYDVLGRPISQGIQILSSLPQDSVDKDSYNQGTKTEQIGFIYDDTSSFYGRTGFTLTEILGSWKGFIDVRNSKSRLLCKFHKNQENATPKFTTKDKFVADFFSYDDRGKIKIAWKFIGPIRDPLKRLQDVWCTYDSRDRLLSYLHYSSADEYALSASQSYSYDFGGRINAITGIGGKPLARYTYNEWGPLDEVELGGLPSGDSTTAMGFIYNSQGAVKEIWATGSYNFGASTKQIFQQFLGYEKNAYAASGTPSLVQARYDGTITQQVYKYTSDMNGAKPVRSSNYAYDLMGRMSKSQAYWNTNSTPIMESTQQINDVALTMDTTGSLSTTVERDLNGRILGQRRAGTSAADSAKYYYTANSHRLDRVTGKLATGSTRNMSGTGTFAYDANGGLIEDRSKKMRISYGWDGLPVSFTMDSIASMGTLRCCTYDANSMPLHFKVRYPSLAQHNFYDADGNRVSRVEVESKPALRTRSTHYVYMAPGMLKEWSEEYHLSGRVKKSSVIVSLYGRGTQIGRIRGDGKYEFFVKNHLGSTMLTVDERGRYEGGDKRAFDYLADGSYKDLKVGTAETVRNKFTGKEFEESTGLYAFGARWLDPEIGAFISPDPAEQFFDPYSYVGGNPINRIDPNGLFAQNSGPPTLSLPDKTVRGSGRRSGARGGSRGGGGAGSNSHRNGIRFAGMSANQIEGIQPISFDLEVDQGEFLDMDALLSMVSFFQAVQAYQEYSAAMESPNEMVQMPGEPTFDFLVRRGNEKLKQSRTWENNRPYYKWRDVPHFLSGASDLVRSAYYYNVRGFENSDQNITEAVWDSPLLGGGPGGATKAIGAARGLSRLPRFQGPKPTYHVNPAHVPGPGLRLGKTPLPGDAGSVFKNAVPNDPVSPTAWFGKNSNGQIYRFSLGNDGTAHFSGIDGVGSGTRNITQYAIDRLNGY